MRPRRILIAATAGVTAVATLALTQTSAAAAPTDLLLSEYVAGASNIPVGPLVRDAEAEITGMIGGFALKDSPSP